MRVGTASLRALAALVALVSALAQARELPCASLMTSLTTSDNGMVSRHEYLYRVHDTPDGPYHETLIVEAFDSSRDLVTHVVKRELRQGAPPKSLHGMKDMPGPDRQAFQGAREWHLALAKEVVGFSIDKYKRRDWTGDFKAKLEKMAEEYLNDSIYVAVNQKSTGKLVGGLRAILAPYGMRDGEILPEGALVRRMYGPASAFRPSGALDAPDAMPRPPQELPEAHFLDVELPRPSTFTKDDPYGVPSGMHIEIGAFAIEESLPPELRSQVWGETWLQLMRIAFEDHDLGLNVNGKGFHTYADPLSRRLYLPMGFDFVRAYKHEGRDVTFDPDEKVTPIRKEETDWWPIQYDLAQIEEYNRKLAAGELPKLTAADLSARRMEIANEPFQGAEGVEMVEHLIAAIASEEESVRAGALRSLEGMFVRYHLQHEKLTRAAPRSPEAVAAKNALSALTPSVEKATAFIYQIISHGDLDEGSWMLRWLSGIAALGVNAPPISHADIVKRAYLPLIARASFPNRISRLRELGALFPPGKLAQVVGAREGNEQTLRLEALSRLRARAVPSELAEETALALEPSLLGLTHPSEWRAHVQAAKALEAIPNLDATMLEDLFRLALTSPLDPAEQARTRLAKGRKKFHELMAKGGKTAERLRARYEAMAAEAEKTIRSGLHDADSHVRFEVPFLIHNFLARADFDRSHMKRETIVKEFFLPLFLDRVPQIRHMALFQLRRSFTRGDLAASLLSDRAPAEASRAAYARLASVGLNPEQAFPTIEALKRILHKDFNALEASRFSSVEAAYSSPDFVAAARSLERLPRDPKIVEAVLTLAALP